MAAVAARRGRCRRRLTRGPYHRDIVLDAVVFDLGGVLVEWDPRHLYRKLFLGDEEAMERFLAEVTTPAWNHEQDAGRTWSEAIEVLAREHPTRRDLIAAYHERWPEMLGGPIEGTVEILRELRDGGVRCFALSNWSAETFPHARERYPFLAWFEGIVISGEERLVKPDPAIFRLLLDRYGLTAAETVFVDDVAANVEAARAIGLTALEFRDPAGLRGDLRSLGFVLRV